MKRATKNALGPALQSVPPAPPEISKVTQDTVNQALQMGSQIAGALSKENMMQMASGVLGLVQILATVSGDRDILLKEKQGKVKTEDKGDEDKSAG